MRPWFTAAATLFLAACAGPTPTPATEGTPNAAAAAGSSRAADGAAAPGIKVPPEALKDPLNEHPIVGAGEPGHYGQWELRFENADSAAKFAALPKARRAKLAAAQVLPQRGIPNRVCPLTGITLAADAVPVTWNDRTIGFATAADAHRFREMSRSDQLTVIENWTRRGGT